MGVTVSCLFLAGVVAAWATPEYTTIDEAIARGDLADVKRHVMANADAANQGKHPKLTPLSQAILRKRTEIAVYLIEAGADVNFADSRKRTSLHLAVDRNLPVLAKALLKAGAKPDLLDSVGWTPLHHAAAKDQLAMAKVLIAGGAQVKTLSAGGGTPLHEAAASGSAEMIQLILDQKVDPLIVANDGGTALDVARHFKNEAAIGLLEPLVKSSSSDHE